MCVPGCQEAVMSRLSRRRFMLGAGGAAAALAVAYPPRAVAAKPMTFSRTVDLTHTLGADFPTYFGKPQLEIEPMFTYAKEKFNVNTWHIVEHTGTHLDAPLHFSADQSAADQIPVEQLVVPLAVVNIATKAEGDADAQVTPDDLKAWEARNGQIPDGACVAMYSGWDKHLSSDKFRNADSAGVMHFPGFHPDATQMMMEERNVIGIAVDTLSLDYGQSKDFATHYKWLPSGRWGLECVANLADLPEVGATIVVGGPKIRGASGGPSRVLALI
jgi:kynurenine formamidase